jgi:hypothetical protein
VRRRTSHRVRQKWLRIGIWIFIFVFAFSIVGGMFGVFAAGLFH